MQSLPIDPLLPAVADGLRRDNCLVLRAPPGAGKTTRVPAAILDAGLAADKHIVVLEPRRIAARVAAEYVARERGGVLGDQVGYRVRFEQRGGQATRLWFVTEGVFSRQLSRDPFIENVAVVVLDEFHERHLQGDVALAVVRELQHTVRPDLRLVAMSATLETETLAAALGDCTVLTSEGRSHPVAVEYAEGAEAGAPLAHRVAGALRRVIEAPRAVPGAPPASTAEGDILVFLPGAAEIRRTATAIEALVRPHGIGIVTLHGNQPLDAQRRALQPGPGRRVILSTNVAETALTVEGVTMVIDSGLARIARLDARHGINTLRVAPISQASADQRAGRAGRNAPGHCIRLWTRADHAGRRAHETPEVQRLDLSAIVLELRGWGLQDPRALEWIDPPPAGALAVAERLLVQLGAVNSASGALTETGGRMLDLPVPPRIARLLVEAVRQGCAEEGACLAALATERDICVEGRALGSTETARWPSGPSDLLLRLDLLEDAARRRFDAGTLRGVGLDPGAVRAVERSRRQLLRVLGGREAGDRPRGSQRRQNTSQHCERAALLRCILAGFPDRVARRRAPGSPRGLMVGGRGVVLLEHSIVRDAELFVAIDVDATAGRGTAEARIRMASQIERRWLAELFPDAMGEISEIVFDHERERVVMRERELFHDLLLAKQVRLDVDPARAEAVLAAAARQDLERAVRISNADRTLLARIAFLQRWMPELALPADGKAFLADVVAGLCAGRCSFAETRNADVGAALRRALTHAQIAALERDAPTHYLLPSGRRAPVVYEPDKPPAVAARIQELFGLRRTPRLARGQVSLVTAILAPNSRPVQITDDLESFWRSTYAEVRKQLRGRYPKHDWPADPTSARPSSRPGKRRP